MIAALAIAAGCAVVVLALAGLDDLFNRPMEPGDLDLEGWS